MLETGASVDAFRFPLASRYHLPNIPLPSSDTPPDFYICKMKSMTPLLA
jgi:hypothetical protein